MLRKFPLVEKMGHIKMITITNHVHVQEEQNNRFEGNRFHFTVNPFIPTVNHEDYNLITSANFFGVKRVKNAMYITVYLFE